MRREGERGGVSEIGGKGKMQAPGLNCKKKSGGDDNAGVAAVAVAVAIAAAVVVAVSAAAAAAIVVIVAGCADG